QSHKERKARVDASRLGGTTRRFGDVQGEHGGQSRKREQCRKQREPARELSENRRPGEAKSEKQESRPWLVESQKHGQPPRIESPYGGNKKPHVARVTIRWSDTWASAGPVLPMETWIVAAKFSTKVTRKPRVEAITSHIH